MDALKNFSYSTVATAPSPATTGTSLTVASGQGSNFPTPPFNATVWATGSIPLSGNAEIVRVTAISGDVLTITRAQESSSARSIVVGDQIAATITAKVLTDIVAAIPSTAGLLSNFKLSAGTLTANRSDVTFSNSNGVSFGLDTNGVITGSVATNYLTTAMASNAATISNVKLSAGTLSALRSDITFANSGGVSFGLNTNGVLTAAVVTNYQASGAYLTTAMQSNAATISNVKVSAGTLSANRSDLTLADSNGISFGLNTNGIVTGTVATNYQSQGAYLTTAMQSNAATLSNIKISAGTLSSNRSNITFGDSNGISFGLDTNGVLTGTVATNYQAQGAYLTTADLSQNSSKYIQDWKLTGNTAGTTSSAQGTDLWFSGGNGVTISGSSNSVIWSVATNYQSPGAYLTTAALSQDSSKYAGVNGAITGGSLTVNTAGVSINLPAYLTTADLSQNSSKYAGINGAITGGSITVNTSGVSVNLPAYLTTAMQSGASTQFVQANAGFAGTNASGTIASSGISISVAAGGAAPNLQYFEAADEVAFGLATNITAINTRPIFIPLWLPGNLTNNGLILQMSRATSGSNAFTVQAGLYTYVNSTSVALLGSLQNAFSASNTASVSGIRYFVMSGWGTNATALTPGAYVLALNFSANGGNTISMNYSLFGGVTASLPVGFVSQGSDQNNTTNTTLGAENFWGRYTVNSAAMPTNVGQSDILANFSGASVPIAPWYLLGQVK